ncbi:MAG: hypothetical protein Q8S13_02050, partial [Dehalococcoidia bacterium]|nr:hypothetical protein [Dehalococcoidia bacterium]
MRWRGSPSATEDAQGIAAGSDGRDDGGGAPRQVEPAGHPAIQPMIDVTPHVPEVVAEVRD